MDPAPAETRPPWPGLPRTRGDGPGTIYNVALVARGFPAHAGMDPRVLSARASCCGLPRTRGDGPAGLVLGAVADEASPHTRGWTMASRTEVLPAPGFPAHAGMDLDHAQLVRRLCRLPRTRGDGPVGDTNRYSLLEASPHTRGWTHSSRLARRHQRGFPAHAGMDLAPAAPGPPASRLPRTRGDGPRYVLQGRIAERASPHTRGWTHLRPQGNRRALGFPAHAGMDPWRAPRAWRRTRLPRTRGDGPSVMRLSSSSGRASPHTRGWTLTALIDLERAKGFPAHAGMDPFEPASGFSVAGLPRTRGDGPWDFSRCLRSYVASPHTRGWTRIEKRAVRPADGFPAPRGDGPYGFVRRRATGLASPHTRGWTRGRRGIPVASDGFPAHAGMDLNMRCT